MTPLGGPLGGVEDQEERGKYRAGEGGQQIRLVMSKGIYRAVRVMVVLLVGLGCFCSILKMVLVNLMMLRVVMVMNGVFVVIMVYRCFNSSFAGDAGWQGHRTVCGGPHHGGYMGGR